MESTDIGKEDKVYESLRSEGNESRSGDHLQCVQDLLPNIYMYIHHLFTFKEKDVCLLLQVKTGAFHLRTSVYLLRTLIVFICARFCISFAHFLAF